MLWWDKMSILNTSDGHFSEHWMRINENDCLQVQSPSWNFLPSWDEAGLGLFISPNYANNHICCPPTRSPEFHCAFGLVQLWFSSLVWHWRESNHSVMWMFNETKNMGGHKASRQPTWLCFSIKKEELISSSHTLHATLDGALLIVIDLLLPSLACSCGLSRTEEHWWHSRIRGSHTDWKAHMVTVWNVCAVTPQCFPYIYILLMVGGRPVQSQGFTVCAVFALTVTEIVRTYLWQIDLGSGEGASSEVVLWRMYLRLIWSSLSTEEGFDRL